MIDIGILVLIVVYLSLEPNNIKEHFNVRTYNYIIGILLTMKNTYELICYISN